MDNKVQQVDCDKHECSECWHFQEPEYAGHPGKCLFLECPVYSNSDICVDFDNRYED